MWLAVLPDSLAEAPYATAARRPGHQILRRSELLALKALRKGVVCRAGSPVWSNVPFIQMNRGRYLASLLRWRGQLRRSRCAFNELNLGKSRVSSFTRLRRRFARRVASAAPHTEEDGDPTNAEHYGSANATDDRDSTNG